MDTEEYLQRLSKHIGNVHEALFGEGTLIAPTDYPPDMGNLTPCLYVQGYPSSAISPALAQKLQANPRVPANDFFLVFLGELRRTIEDAAFGRPHIRKDNVICDIATRAVWLKVSGGSSPNKELLLGPDIIAHNLPEGFRFLTQPPNLSTAKAVTEYYKHELEGWAIELGPSILKQQGEAVGRLSIVQWAEAGFISRIGVELAAKERLQFLRACKDAIMAKK